MTSGYQFKNQFLTLNIKFLNRETSSHEQKNARIRSIDMYSVS